jgi:hypothetical protein
MPRRVFSRQITAGLNHGVETPDSKTTKQSHFAEEGAKRTCCSW